MFKNIINFYETMPYSSKTKRIVTYCNNLQFPQLVIIDKSLYIILLNPRCGITDKYSSYCCE